MLIICINFKPMFAYEVPTMQTMYSVMRSVFNGKKSSFNFIIYFLMIMLVLLYRSAPLKLRPNGAIQIYYYYYYYYYKIIRYLIKLILRSHSYCLSLPLCLEWYSGSITTRVHSGVTKLIECRLYCQLPATVE